MEMKLEREAEPSLNLSDEPAANFSDVVQVVGVSFACVLLLLGGLATCARLVPRDDQLHDFVQEWTSGRNYFEGQPIYGDLRESVANYLHPGLVGLLPIRVNAHPPVAVLVTLPLAQFDYKYAILVWNLLSLAMLGLSLWMILARRGLKFSPQEWLVVLAIVFACSPLAHQIYMAQLNLLLLLLLTGAWFAERHKLHALSGALIGAAAAVKVFPAFLFVYFLGRRQLASLASGAIAFAGLNLAAYWVLGGNCFDVYLNEVIPEVGGFSAAWTNASLMGFWARLFDVTNPDGVVPLYASPGLAKFAAGTCMLALSAATGWKCWQWRRTRPDQSFALAVIGMLLVSPIAWHHYFVMLILPLAILWRRSPGDVRHRCFLTATVILLAINPWWVMDAIVPGDGELAWWPGAQRSVATPIYSLTVISFQFYTLLALFGYAFCLGRSERGTRHSERASETSPTGQPAEPLAGRLAEV